MMLDKPFNKSTLFHGPGGQQHADFTAIVVEMAIRKTGDHEVTVHQRKVLTGHDQAASVFLGPGEPPSKIKG